MRDKTQTAIKYLKTIYQDLGSITSKKKVNTELKRIHGSGCPIIMLELQLRGYVKPQGNQYLITSKANDYRPFFEKNINKEVVKLLVVSPGHYNTVITLSIDAPFEDKFTQKLNTLIEDFNKQTRKKTSPS